MKKSDVAEPKKTRIFKVEVPSHGSTLRRGKAKVTKLPARESKASLVTLILSIVLCVAILPLAQYVLQADWRVYASWLLSSLLLGLAVYPLALKLFKRHSGLAWLFAPPLGLSLIAFSIWTLSYLKLMAFTRSNIIIVSLAWAAIAYLNPKTMKPALLSLFRRSQWRALFLSVAAFAYALMLMAFVRGLMPAARGLEKFMDYGFMMSLWRSDFLPAADMWFSGQSINYYYFGQFIYTFLAKFSNVPVNFAYNLSMGSTFAYMLSMAYGLGYLLLSLLGKRLKLSQRLKVLFASLAGIGSAVYTCFAGNAHDFFISPIAPGKWLLQCLAAGTTRFGNLDQYFFPDATRYIGYNPPTVDQTIHEFPYYSFLVGDLHAHLANTVFVLLFIASVLLLLESQTLLRFYRKLRGKKLFLTLNAYDSSLLLESRGALRYSRLNLLGAFLRSWCLSGVLPLTTLLLGIFMTGNFWDFPIYWVVLAFFLSYTAKRAIGPGLQLITLPLGLMQIVAVFLPFLFVSDTLSQSWFFLAAMLFAILLFILRPGLWTGVGLSLNMSFALAHLLIIPFNQAFSPMAKEIAIVPYHTPLYQLLVLYGPQALVFLLFALSLIGSALLRYKRQGKASAEESSAIMQQQVPAPVAETAVTTNNRGWLNRKTILPQTYMSHIDKRNERVQSFRAKASSERSFTRRFHLGSFAILLLFIAAFGLILAPEFIYVRDIYEQGFARANTMFKFTYQASILLGLALPAAAVALVLEFLHQGRLNALARKEPGRRIRAEQMDMTAGIPLQARLSDKEVLDEAKASISRRIGRRPRRLWRAPFFLVFALVLLALTAPLVYPFAATFTWLPAFKTENYKGLDASQWMLTETSPQIAPELGEQSLQDDWALIQWLNEHVSGQPHIVEANGLSYTESCRISAFTGLPTVLGWQTHEWLWRTGVDQPNAYASLIAPREGDVRSIYEAHTAAELRSLLKIYQIEYIILGNIERTAFPGLNEALLESMGEVVYRMGDSTLIQVRN